MQKPLAAALALLLLPASGQAESYEVSSRIVAVTVQPDRAQVQRLARLEIAAGGNVLLLPDLPATIDRASLRVTTENTDVAFGRAEFLEVQTAEPVNPAVRALTAEGDRLREQRRVETDAIKTAELQLTVLGRTQLTVELDDAAAPGDPTSLFGMLESRSRQALQMIRRAEGAIRAIDTEIARVERQLEALGQDPMRRLEVRLPLSADAAGPLEFEIGYAVRGAGFTPHREARLDPAAGTVELAAFAEVTQQTGEDWIDVALSLSTAQPSWQTAAPPADPWYIDIRRDDEPSPKVRTEAARSLAMAAAPEADVAIDRSGFDVAYDIQGPQTIRADGTQKRVPVETVQLPADVVWQTVPALDPRAYLTADLTYDGEATLLPGQVRLYRDGMAIGETWDEALVPGAEREWGFGHDPAIAIDYRLLTDLRAAAGLIGSTRRHERRFRIEATNHRAGPVILEIIERLPVPRDARIEVRLLPDTTTPDTTEHDEKPGVLAWTRTVEPGQSLELLVAYEVRHPADLEVTDF